MSALRAGAPIHAGGVCLIPVERVWLQQHAHGGAVWAAGGREPVAVVIKDAKGVCAVDVAGEAVALDKLLGDVDGLSAALDLPPGEGTGTPGGGSGGGRS